MVIFLSSPVVYSWFVWCAQLSKSRSIYLYFIKHPNILLTTVQPVRGVPAHSLRATTHTVFQAAGAAMSTTTVETCPTNLRRLVVSRTTLNFKSVANTLQWCGPVMWRLKLNVVWNKWLRCIRYRSHIAHQFEPWTDEGYDRVINSVWVELKTLIWDEIRETVYFTLYMTQGILLGINVRIISACYIYIYIYIYI